MALIDDEEDKSDFENIVNKYCLLYTSDAADD